MRYEILIALMAGAVLAAGQQNPSLGDILKGGVKSPPPNKQHPRTAPAQSPRQQPRPPAQGSSGTPAEERRVAAPAQANGQAVAGSGFRIQLPPGWRAELTPNRAILARSADGAS